jgi:hypothetical protein
MQNLNLRVLYAVISIETERVLIPNVKEGALYRDYVSLEGYCWL